MLRIALLGNNCQSLIIAIKVQSPYSKILQCFFTNPFNNGSRAYRFLSVN